MGVTCIGMMSGGLDSRIAARCMLDQGLDVRLLHFHHPFHGGRPGNPAQQAADQLGLPLMVRDLDERFFDVIKDPRWGTGKGLNPCIDCRIHQLRNATKIAEEIGAKFIFTGEVLGQRPMSQHRRAMRTVAREAGLKGQLLRPLSARLLAPTVAETEGWVDRDALLEISGRGRKPQMELARQWGLTDYPGPAGGCLLTDRNFARRMEDLLATHPDCVMADIEPLKLGRHFRTPDGVKLVVGRNQAENQHLRDLESIGIRVYMDDLPGPMVLVLDDPDGAAVGLAGDAAFAHSSTNHEGSLDLCVIDPGGGARTVAHTPSAGRHELRTRLGLWRL
jgi:tRNA-uridine 2-sulfurtransferase